MSKRLFSIVPALIAIISLIIAPALPSYAEQITIRDENKMGSDFDKIIRTQMSMVGDSYITDYVADLVNQVVEAKAPMPFRVKSAVIADPTLNAFAIPGGFIYVFTGLIQEVTSESQLVGVIAHELAHVSQRHVASRLEKQGKVAILSTAGLLAGILLGVAGGGSTAAKAGSAIMMSSQGIATAAMLKYSQEDENEADNVGINTLVKAGYNPQGMPQTFEIMQKNRWFDTSTDMPSYLSTHPGLADRITYLNDRIKRMPTAFTTRKDDNTRLHKVQVLIRSKMSPATAALAYWNNMKPAQFAPMDYIGRGIVLERLKNTDEAQTAIEQALHLDGEDELIVREAGIFYFKVGNNEKAVKLLQKAVIKDKNDAMALFYLSRLQAENKDYARAADNMRKVLELVPEDWEVHQQLGMILGESGDIFSGNLHLAYSAVYSHNTRKAWYHAEQAGAAATTDAQKESLKQLQDIIQERENIGK